MDANSMAILVLLGSFFLSYGSPSLMRWRFHLCSAFCSRDIT